MAEDLQNQGTIEVTTPSRASFYVLTESERDYYHDMAGRYLNDNKFGNISDLQDLDRVLMMELMIYRWGRWISSECDYWGQEIDPERLNKGIKEFSTEVRQLKKAVGIDKPSRDRDKGESFATYVEDLRRRAKEFGVLRNEQAVAAITLFQELIALVQWHDNCTDEEKRENDIEAHDIIEWVRQVKPEFTEIDRKFRESSQKYWISDM